MRGHHTRASPVLLPQPKAPPCALTPFPTLFFPHSAPIEVLQPRAEPAPQPARHLRAAERGCRKLKLGLEGKILFWEIREKAAKVCLGPKSADFMYRGEKKRAELFCSGKGGSRDQLNELQLGAYSELISSAPAARRKQSVREGQKMTETPPMSPNHLLGGGAGGAGWLGVFGVWVFGVLTATPRWPGIPGTPRSPTSPRGPGGPG